MNGALPVYVRTQNNDAGKCWEERRMQKDACNRRPNINQTAVHESTNGGNWDGARRFLNVTFHPSRKPQPQLDSNKSTLLPPFSAAIKGLFVGGFGISLALLRVEGDRNCDRTVHSHPH